MFRLLSLLILALLPLQALDYYGMKLERYDYPFEVKTINLITQNQMLSMAYMDLQPEKSNGQTVLLLHGKNFTGAYWEETAKALAKEGYRVVMPDQVGFGKSDKPEHLQYTFQMLAHNTATLLERLGIAKVHVLGHSMGGMIATRFALMFPEKTQKLILENPIGLEDWQRFAPNPSFDYWYKRELGKTPKAIKLYQLKSYYDNQWKRAYDPWVDILASFTENQEEYPRVAFNQALISEMIYSQPVCYQFDQLKMPVLLIIGQRDKTALGKELAPKELQEQMGNYPDLGRKTAQAIPRATLMELIGVGHLPHIEAFDPFIRGVVDFLSRKE